MQNDFIKIRGAKVRPAKSLRDNGASNFIRIRGAKVHNLKNVNLDIPKNKLIVITGLSGSGKSSLAFDTLYAEGQRRYVESLSAYARQFLGVMDKPEVDRIDGLSPAIAIDQKSVSKNPRSTVGTITEIYDYLRLLFARVGKPYCPQCGKIIAKQNPGFIVDNILKMPAGMEINILGPLVRGKKGEHKGAVEQAQKAGFVRARVDGVIYPLDEAVELRLDKQKKHSIEILVDKIKIPEKSGQIDKDERARILDSVETALKIGKGIAIVNAPPRNKKVIASDSSAGGERGNSVDGGKKAGLLRRSAQGGTPRNDIAGSDIVFSELFACDQCGISLPEIEPRLFSFNSPFGACPVCQGLGVKQEIDPALVIPNYRLTLAEGAVKPLATASHRVGRQGWYYWQLSRLAGNLGFSTDVPVQNLSKKNIDAVLYGAGDFEGVIPGLERRWRETDSEFARAEIEKYMIVKKCPACGGRRLKPEALAVKINNYDISQVAAMPVGDLVAFFSKKLKLAESDNKIAGPITKEISKRLNFLLDVGLDYLTLERNSTTLSGGEAQRIRLATQIGSGLAGVLYILDEPSIGLHQRDMQKLIDALKDLRDLGNTVVVVEHDAQTIMAADYVVDVGPGAGEHGGKVIFAGTPKEILKADTLTGEYLSGKKSVVIASPAAAGRSNPVMLQPFVDGGKTRDRHVVPDKSGTPRDDSRSLQILGASEHNLKNIDVKIPLGKFVAVAGVSGSGKSSLVNDILGAALSREFHGAHDEPGKHREIKGAENLDKVIIVDQSPIGRTPRSNPATYTGVFTPVRDIFAQTREARVRGYGQGRFSFNVKGGRCEDCQGDGVKKIEMYFLPDIYIECEVCHGRRYSKETLEIEYKGKNIAQVLAMSIDEARDFFKNIPAIETKLKTLKMVGLGYMKLGQNATTLSGGEAQRIKLATELARRATGRTLYILDEPTTGLHFDDIRKLLKVLRELVARGNSVLVIEHNLDVIRSADWIVDLGPEGGDGGGRIVAEGEVDDIIKNNKSWTGKYLKK